MIIAIVGPTASGKSKLAIQLAKRYQGEIISGDSMQVYREMKIGTACIKDEEMQGIKHYFIADRSYQDCYNVKIFQKEAREVIDNILQRKKTVIICGGTGLYIKALLYDYEFQDEEIDLEYYKELEKLTNEQLWNLLQKKDPLSLEKLHINNRKRLIRCLMMAKTGDLKSERLKRQEHKMIYDAHIFYLEVERENLYEKINQRVDQMIEEGLESEVKNLIQDDDSWKLQSMASIGYKEWESYFKNEKSKEEVIALIKKNTRNFAKRQFTFFKNQLPIIPINTLKDPYLQICNYLEQNYEK